MIFASFDPDRLAAPLKRVARLVVGAPAPADEETTADAPVPDATALPGGRALFDAMAGLASLHAPSGEVRAFGGAEREAFAGWMALEPGRAFLDQIHIADRLAFLQAFDALRQDESSRKVALRIAGRRLLGESEQFVPVEMSLTALRDGEGALTAVLGQTRRADDAIARKAEMEALAEKAARAEVEKSRFLAAVSHEMRTPLNAIIGFSEILGREYFGPLTEPRQREYVDLIKSSGEHMLSLVNAMLDMSKIEAGRYRLREEAFPVSDVVEGCGDMLRLQAERKGIGLATRVTRDCGLMRADRRAVRQILINLIGNAVKFTDPGGVVTVDAERRGASIRLSVCDTGIGMASSVIARLGEPFVQAEGDYDRNHEGAGLGLCLVKGLVDLHGGRLTIESAPGKGTAVTVELPAEGGAPAAAAPRRTVTALDFSPRPKQKEDEAFDGTAKHGATAKSA